MKLNESQKKAVCHREGPALVLAGPGSGKTTVLTQRVKNLIGEGVKPSSILVVTFTRSAAKEMEQRFLKSCSIRGEGVTFSTCHALFYRILRKECGYTERDVISEKERLKILKDLLRRYQLDPGEELLRYVSADISRVKNSGLIAGAGMTAGRREASASAAEDDSTAAESGADPFAVSWCSGEMFRSIYEAYNDVLRRRHKIEFDDMTVLCLELFRSSHDVLRRWQQVWSEVLVDEYQDINPLQNQLLHLLAAPENNLFVVGDEDQSIYAFRGSSPKLITDFEADHPGCSVILLDTNYRCAEEIIELSRKLIEKNEVRIEKRIRGTGRTGGSIRVIPAVGQRMEAQMITEDIRRRLSDGTSPEELAVLYRSRSAVTILQQELSARLVPYRLKQKQPDLYAHWITRDIFAYFSLAQNRDSTADLLRILNRPERNLPRELFARSGMRGSEAAAELLPAEEEAYRRLMRDLDRIRRLKPYAAMHYIMDGVGYERVLHEHAVTRQVPESDLREVTDFLYEAAGGYDSFAEWKEAEETRQQQREREVTREDGILLSTIHGAKGLEFDTVYLMNLNETLLPIKAAVSLEQIEEERRLCYVAMTRARKNLMLYTLSHYHAHQVQPSRFLADAGLEAESEIGSGRTRETGIDEKDGNR